MTVSARRATPDCPYCEGIPSVGPRAPRSPSSTFNTVLASGPGVVLTPTVGMLVPGYLLAVTTNHLDSVAALGSRTLSELDQWITGLLEVLAPVFGNYMVFEHGSGGRRTDAGSGACIVHGHLHLIPDSGTASRTVLTELSPQPIDALADAAAFASMNYALVRTAGQWSVRADVDLPGQWVRRQVAASISRAAEYDWAVFSGESQLHETLEALRPLHNALLRVS